MPPLPVSGETLDELSASLVHTDFPENKAPRDWSIRISPEIHMDQWLPNPSESSVLDRHRPIACSSLLLVLLQWNGEETLFTFKGAITEKGPLRDTQDCDLPPA